MTKYLKQNTHILDKKMFFLLLLLYIIAVLTRALLIDSIWYKIWGDELLYNDMARSLINDGTFKFANMYCSSNAYLYPMFLAVVLKFFYSAETVSFVARFCGILAMTTVIIPTYILAKKMEYTKSQAFVMCCFSVIVPDMMQGLFTVTEVIAYPLFMWTILFFYMDIESKKIGKNTILFAVFIYLSYMTRSLNLGLLVAYIIYSFIMCAMCMKKHLYSQIKVYLFKTGSVVAIVGILHTMVTSFFTYADIISATSPSVNASSGILRVIESLKTQFLYSVVNWSYDVFLYIFYTLLAFGFFTVIVPLFYRYADEKNNAFLIFINIAILCFIGIIVVMVQAKEEPVTREERRIHIRYLFYFFIPYLLLLYKTDLKKIKWIFAYSISGILFLVYAILLRYLYNLKYTIGVCSMMLSTIRYVKAFVTQYPQTESFFYFITVVVCIAIYSFIRQYGMEKFLKKVFPAYMVLFLFISNCFYYAEIRDVTVRGNSLYQQMYTPIAKVLNQYQQGEVVAIADSLTSDNEIQSMQLFLEKSIDKISYDELKELITESAENYVQINTFERSPFLYASEQGHTLKEANYIVMRKSIASQLYIQNNLIYEDNYFTLYELDNGKFFVSLSNTTQ